MKTFKLNTVGFVVAGLLSLFIVQCSDDDAPPPPATGESQLTVMMSDAPGDYQAVNIEVLDIMVKSSSEEGDEGWISLGDSTVVGEGKIYNLLELTGGNNIILADSLVPSGYLGQMRLMLGDQNTVIVDGATYPLSTPSAEQSGLKLNINQTLSPGIEYKFMLDFDVNKSIVTTGNGTYKLKPVIRVSTTAATGSIKGMITPVPSGYQVLVSVPVNGTTVTAYANAQGMFQLDGVPAGTYTVTFASSNPDTAQKTVPNITVVNGQVTDMLGVTYP